MLLGRVIAPLDRKLLRDLWRLRSQSLAIALVIGSGVAMFVMSRGMLIALEDTRAAYYERNGFAQVFAAARRAPESLVQRLGDIPGVRTAIGRVRAPAIFDVEGDNLPITGLLLSVTDGVGPRINKLTLTQGRLPDETRPDEVVALESFALAHGLRSGDRLSAVINGHRRVLTIVGLALTPEFIYTLPPGDLVPDDKRFGVLWMGRKALAEAFDMDGAFNEALLLLRRDASEAAVIDAVDRLLEPYGGVGAHGRDRQASHQFLSNEIVQLGVMADILPPIFLLVAAFLLSVVTSRLIDTERDQIGLLKAFGYPNRTVAGHYLKFVLGIVALGTLGGIIGGNQLGRGLAKLYMQYFKFPFLLFEPPSVIYLQAALISLGAGIAGALAPVMRAARLDPAVAMRPPVPTDYSATAAPRRVNWLDPSTRMMLRHIRRWPRRAAMTTLGVGMGMGLMIGAGFSLDSIDFIIDATFNRIDRQDMTVTLVEPRNRDALHAIARLPGVILAEPYRAVPARLRFGNRQRVVGIQGVDAQSTLSRPHDAQLRPVAMPDDGLVLSDKLADVLGVRAGDTVRVEVMDGRRPVLDLPVAAVVASFMGMPAYMQLQALNRALGEGDVISGAQLSVDSASLDALYRQLKQTPAVAGVALQDEAQKAFDKAMDESMGTTIFFNSLFAAVIAIGVVYNAARVALSERARELASLRVLGFTRAEASGMLLGEIAVLVTLGLPVGAFLGYALAAGLTASLDTELFRIPLIIAPSTYALAGLVVLLAAVASALVVRRRIDKLDLVAVLKTRD